MCCVVLLGQPVLYLLAVIRSQLLVYVGDCLNRGILVISLRRRCGGIYLAVVAFSVIRRPLRSFSISFVMHI